MKQCTDTNVHYTYDTYALANGTGKAVVKQGGDTWFFPHGRLRVRPGAGEGHYRGRDASQRRQSARLGAPSFPGDRFLVVPVKAQASGAKVIGLANAGTDTTNSIKQAAEFGITPKQSLAGLLMFITDVHSLGLKATQGMYLTEGFYWDFNDETRAWSKRFFELHKRMPTMVQAGDYSSTMHYLKAVKAAGTDEAGR